MLFLGFEQSCELSIQVGNCPIRNVSALCVYDLNFHSEQILWLLCIIQNLSTYTINTIYNTEFSNAAV